jgi:ligand-binding SRPBCC domain-containing protein
VNRLDREIRLPRPRDAVFGFFADPGNLEFLTPSWLGFRIVEPRPSAVSRGARIRYRLRLRGIPVAWTSVISAWEPPRRFVDEQVRGPYRIWIHEHTFEEDGDGTVVRDRVLYAVPGGVWVDRLLVRPDLERIFDYRHERLRERFPGAAIPGEPRWGEARE